MKISEVFPYLCVTDTAKAIEFYKEAFGATEKFRLTDPEGRIGHAELDFGGHTLMFADEFPDYGFEAPRGASSCFQIHLHVDNADEFVARAVSHGATVLHPVQDKFYGERSGTIRDPFGHRWNIGHAIEAVTTDEMQKRYDETKVGS